MLYRDLVLRFLALFFSFSQLVACGTTTKQMVINDRSYEIAQDGDQGIVQTRILYAAIDANSIETAKKAIESGALIDSYLQNGQTPLLFTIDRQNYELVKLLIAKKADVNKKGIYNRTPLMHAISAENIDIVKLLLNNGADVNAVDSYGRSALFFCLDSGNMPVMMEIAKVVEKNVKDTYNVGYFWTAFAAKAKGFDVRNVHEIT